MKRCPHMGEKWIQLGGSLVAGLRLVAGMAFSLAQKPAVGKGGARDYFKANPAVFQKKTPPGPSDWLSSHYESGQTYAQYLNSNPHYPDQRRKVLYVIPLGEFGESAPKLSSLDDYMTAYFHPMKVRVMKTIPDEEVVAKSRMNGGVKQWKTGDILRWMEKRLPADAYGMLAVTMTDLYPDEQWNFVFGQATYKKRVGVFSFARYGSEDEKLVLLRAGKVLTHEMGHMFGIKHCIAFQCNMNGANHLMEVVRSPPHLCPVCLEKLHRAVKFDPKERYEKLLEYYDKQELKVQANWTRARLGVAAP